MNIMWTVLLVLVFLLFFPLVKVSGYSMYPTIQSGDILFSARVFRHKNCKPGHIYVYRLPNERKVVIKRLICIAEEKYFFEGDNKEASHDSRYYGLIDPKHVIAEAKGILYRKNPI